MGNLTGVNVRNTQNGEMIQRKSWEEEVNWDEDTVEMAGDYIFVYEYDGGIAIKEKQELDW